MKHIFFALLTFPTFLFSEINETLLRSFCLDQIDRAKGFIEEAPKDHLELKGCMRGHINAYETIILLLDIKALE